MKIKSLAILLVSLSFLVACQKQDGQDTGKQEQATSAVDKADAIASVNGKYISKAALEKLKAEIAQRMPGKTFPEQQMVDELVKREILVQAAIEKKLDQSPEVKEQIEALKYSILSQAVLQDFFNNNEISDAELKAEYDKKMSAGSSTEFKARHILVKTEDEAKDIIAKLDAGGDFIELAKEFSTGPSGPNGGDLGWFGSEQMVKPFTEGVMALENGKYTSAPVQTNFGYHVILREDSRQKSLPDFETVKTQLMPMLQQQKMMDYFNQLKEQATIEYLIKEEPAPAPETAEAPAAEAAPADAAAAQVEPVAVESAEHGHEHKQPASEVAEPETAAVETVKPAE